VDASRGNDKTLARIVLRLGAGRQGDRAGTRRRQKNCLQIHGIRSLLSRTLSARDPDLPSCGFDFAKNRLMAACNCRVGSRSLVMS
jgi:hypothetical protein